jgi:sugar phosphate isomerase/epimerase
MKVGIVIMDRYDLFCECQYHWNDPALDECGHRVLSAHAPYEAQRGGESVRLNIASGDEEFRKKSVAMIENFVRGATRAPNCQTIVCHPAPHYWNEDAGKPCDGIREVGEYGHFIESLKHLSRVAGDAGLRFTVENNRNPWHDIPPEEDYDHEKHAGNVREYFATSPKEWANLPDDVADPAFALCLDTSHMVTYAQRFPDAARDGMVDLYLTLGGDHVHHVHWSDNIVKGRDGRDDKHMTLGKGTIQRQTHRDVWALPNAQSWLLEHWLGEGDLAFEMRYIERL